MAGWQIETPAAGSTAWDSFETQVQYTRSGLFQLSLNPIIDGTTPPRVAAGSKVDISGGLYYFGSTETVAGSATTTNTNYIMLTTSSSSITASYTSEVPSWSASKNGWYDATGNKRMIGRLDFDSTTYEVIGLLPRGESLWDKNGREVLAMQMETKNNVTGASLATNTEVDVDVTGFSWTPTAIMSASVAWGTSSTLLYGQTSFPGSGGVAENERTLSIVSLTPGTDKVTIRLRNSNAVTAIRYDNIIVTAVRAP